MNEQQLIQGCINQDKKSWDHFVERYNKLIYSTLHGIFREKAIAPGQDVVEELFNETFVVLLKDDAKKLRQFQGKCSFASWIRLITTNVAIDYLRKLKPTVSLDEKPDDGPSLIELLTVDDNIKANLSQEDEKEIFARILGKLDSKDQLLLRLLFIDEISPEEAGRIMGFTKDAIYMRKSRLVNQLKQLISEEIVVRKKSDVRLL